MSKNFAILIGINKYDFLGKLNFARQDAEQFSKTLKEKIGFRDSEISLMTCESDGSSRAISNYIESKINVISDLGELDTFIFGFWGHGFSSEKNERYLCAIDTKISDLKKSAVSLDFIQSRITKISALKSFIILDCCQARPPGRGAVADSEVGRDDDLASAVQSIQRRTSLIGRPPETTAILSSCREGKFAYEWKERGHGVFTAHLIDAIYQGIRDVAGLATYVSDQVPQTSLLLVGERQEPWFFAEGRGNFPLSPYAEIERVTSFTGNHLSTVQQNRENVVGNPTHFGDLVPLARTVREAAFPFRRDRPLAGC